MFPQRLCALAVALCAMATPANAQRQAGPYAPLLGAPEPSDARHILAFRGSIYGAWDDVSSETQGLTTTNRFLRSGFAGGAFGGLNHARRSRRTQWLSSASTEMRAYTLEQDGVAATFAGRTRLNATLNTRVSFVSSLGVQYSPYYAFS